MACIMGINKNACRTAWLINEIWCQTQVAEHPLLIVVAPVYCLPPLEFQVCVWEVCGFWGVCALRHNFLFLANYFSVSYWISWAESAPAWGGWRGCLCCGFLPSGFLFGFWYARCENKIDVNYAMHTHTGAEQWKPQCRNQLAPGTLHSPPLRPF